ncbi:MAG: hypothetical protein KDK70_37645 [Myxococcales bacterium]|nr:hypothetical protein [Myxococcales bacterium]
MLTKILFTSLTLCLAVGCMAEDPANNETLTIERIGSNTWLDVDTLETYMIEGQDDTDIYSLASAALDEFEVSLQREPDAHTETLIEVYSQILDDLEGRNPEVVDDARFRLFKKPNTCSGGGGTCSCSGSCTADSKGCACTAA